jgi:hypothetical protein
MSLCLIPVTDDDLEWNKDKTVAHCKICKQHCLIYAKGFIIT